MQNPILGIENPYLKLLFKHISLFEKNFDHDLKFWIQHFYAIFGKLLNKRLWVLTGRSNIEDVSDFQYDTK